MMKTRPLNLARPGLVAASVLLIAAGCTSSDPTWTPPLTSGAAATPPASAAAPSAAPSAGASAGAALPTPTAAAPSPAAPTPRATITGNLVIPTPRAPGSSAGPVTGEPAATPGASEPAIAPATERPGPTPIIGELKPAPDFVDMVKSDGTPYSLAEDRGHWTIVFFGYTHCPDVCPATIGELIQVEQARPDVHVIFVTVDPERDTPEFLADWTEYLPEGLTAITGSPLAIRHAADTWGVRYARVDTGSKAGYSMSHTAFQYLIDAEGNLVLTYPFGTPAAAILGDLDQLDRAG